MTNLFSEHGENATDPRKNVNPPTTATLGLLGATAEASPLRYRYLPPTAPSSHCTTPWTECTPQPLRCVLCRLIRRLWAVAAVPRVGRDIFLLLFTLSLSGNPRLRSDWWAKATKTVGGLTFQPNRGRTRPIYSDSEGCAR